MTSKRLVILLTTLLLVSVVVSDLVGQCPMCRMSAETNLQDGGTAGKGLNNGILYMFFMPYLLVGLLGFIWYKNSKKDSAYSTELP